MQGMIALILCMALFCSAAISVENDGSGWKMRHGGQKYEETGTGGQVQTPLYAGILAEFRTNEIEILVDNHEILTEAAERAAEEAAHPEQGVYTFLQGPKSWEEGRAWSGEWSNQYVRGNYFGNFGCGLCCMANIYSSLTPYQCSPVDMYRYAKKHTGYGGGMAIDWGYIRRGLTSLGLHCHVERKQETYHEFRENIRKSKCAIVLVSSANSTVHWKNTPGHYVTIFEFQEKTDKVFLADSGDPDHNRRWIHLKKVYRSLKTASNWQYLVVSSYDKQKDHWHHKKADGTWNRPSYLKAKS